MRPGRSPRPSAPGPYAATSAYWSTVYGATGRNATQLTPRSARWGAPRRAVTSAGARGKDQCRKSTRGGHYLGPHFAETPETEGGVEPLSRGLGCTRTSGVQTPPRRQQATGRIPRTGAALLCAASRLYVQRGFLVQSPAVVQSPTTPSHDTAAGAPRRPFRRRRPAPACGGWKSAGRGVGRRGPRSRRTYDRDRHTRCMTHARCAVNRPTATSWQ